MKRVWLGIVCVCLVAATWFARSAFTTPPSSPIYHGSSEPTRDSVQALDRHEALIEEALESTSAPIALPPAAAKREPADSVWRRRYPRTRSDIVRYLMDHADRVDHRKLLRNRTLNERDLEISANGVEQLRLIVAMKGKPLRRLMRNFRDLRRKEIHALIESGRMQPAALPTRSDAELRRVAERLARRPGSTRTAAAWYEELRAQPQFKGTHHHSFTQHGGHVYLWCDIASLPHSDKLLAEIHQLSFELVGFVVSFFENQRCLSNERANDLLRRAMERQPAHSRKKT